jgi:hypothetical protein
LKKSIEEALRTNNGEILHPDLSKFLNCAETDGDINLLVEGLKRFQSRTTKVDYRLSALLMQLFYISNGAHNALELFMDKVWFKF